MADLKKALSYVLDNEGRGFEDYPKTDQPTNSGIIAADVAEHRRVPLSQITRDVMRHLSDQEIEDIYREQYWNKILGDQIKDQNIATAIFDCSVIRGRFIGVKYTQRVCNVLGGALVVDGQFGLHTLAAVNQVDRAPFIRHLEMLMEAGFEAIAHAHSQDNRYLQGWLNRARRLFTLLP